jgi:hypothetical protein
MKLRRIIPLFLLLGTMSGGCLWVDRGHDGWRNDGWRDDGWRERRQDWRDYRLQRRWWWRDRDHDHDREHDHDDD